MGRSRSAVPRSTPTMTMTTRSSRRAQEEESRRPVENYPPIRVDIINVEHQPPPIISMIRVPVTPDSILQIRRSGYEKWETNAKAVVSALPPVPRINDHRVEPSSWCSITPTDRVAHESVAPPRRRTSPSGSQSSRRTLPPVPRINDHRVEPSSWCAITPTDRVAHESVAPPGRRTSPSGSQSSRRTLRPRKSALPPVPRINDHRVEPSSWCAITPTDRVAHGSVAPPGRRTSPSGSQSSRRTLRPRKTINYSTMQRSASRSSSPKSKRSRKRRSSGVRNGGAQLSTQRVQPPRLKKAKSLPPPRNEKKLKRGRNHLSTSRPSFNSSSSKVNSVLEKTSKLKKFANVATSTDNLQINPGNPDAHMPSTFEQLLDLMKRWMARFEQERLSDPA